MRIAIIVILSMYLIPAHTQESFSLSEAIKYALDHSNDIKLDLLEVENADAQVTEFKSIGMPKITANVDYSYYFLVPAQPVEDFLTPAIYGVLEAEDLAEPFTGDLQTFEFAFQQPNNLALGVSAESLIFDGSYLVGLRAAKLFRDLQRKKIEVTEQEIRSNVTKAYTNILVSLENKRMIDKNIENITKSLNDAKATYESGFLEQLDVDRLQLSFENLQTQSENLNQIIELSKNLLKFQMNYPLEKGINLSEDLENMVNVLKVTEMDLSESLDISNRAEIAQIEKAQELNRLNIERLNKGKLPSVFARANYSENLQRVDLFNNQEAGFFGSSFVGLGVSLPIYDGGERSGQVQQAKIAVEKTDIELQQFKRATTMQLLNAKLQYKNAKKTLENRERALEIVQNIYDKTKIKFEEGIGSSVELSQAESSLYESQSNYINALYDIVNAKIEIDIASGKLK